MVYNKLISFLSEGEYDTHGGQAMVIVPET